MEHGKPPRGFAGWAYKKVHHMDNVVRHNVQIQIDQLHRKYSNQHAHPQSPVGSDMDIEEEDQNGPPPQPEKPPHEGSSSSDSD